MTGIRLKIISFITNWLFLLCLPVLLLTASIGLAVNSLWLYQYGFTKYDISRTTGLADVELDKATSGLISYFNSNEEYISLSVIKDNKSFELFNQREAVHLKDVKGLFWLDYRVLLVTLLYISGYVVASLFWWKDRRRLAWAVVKGSGLTLALGLALGVGILLDFDQLFYQFHLLSFANDLWQLDPTTDYLIMLFPQGFWYDVALFCALAAAAGAIILGGAAAGHLVFHRSQTKS